MHLLQPLWMHGWERSVDWLLSEGHHNSWSPAARAGWVFWIYQQTKNSHHDTGWKNGGQGQTGKRNTSLWKWKGASLCFTPKIKRLQGRWLKWVWCGFVQLIFLFFPQLSASYCLSLFFPLCLSWTVFISMSYCFPHFFSLRLSLCRFITPFISQDTAYIHRVKISLFLPRYVATLPATPEWLQTAIPLRTKLDWDLLNL